MKANFISKCILLATASISINCFATSPSINSSQQGIQAVIFDWAGTTVDYGSFAPIKAFKQVFAEEGVEISNDEARAPMGVHKRTHIEKITQLKPTSKNQPSIEKRWQDVHAGQSPTPKDIDKMFARFIPLQLEAIKDHATLIDGTLDTFNYVKSKGWKVGTTTGYTTEMLSLVQEQAENQGYKPDFNVASDMVSKARPTPNMVFKNCAHFNISPSYIVKIDDTIPGIEEGLNAGAWTIMVLESGNALGLTQIEAAKLTSTEKQSRLKLAKSQADKLAHYTVQSIAEVPEVLDKIDNLIKQGNLAFDYPSASSRA
jgi:phosphonoacetaldehyde hydrolase